jgi:hypothetical protein
MRSAKPSAPAGAPEARSPLALFSTVVTVRESGRSSTPPRVDVALTTLHFIQL